MKRFRPISSSDDEENAKSKHSTPQNSTRTRLVDRSLHNTPDRRPLRTPVSQPIDQFIDISSEHSKYKFFSGTGEPLVKAEMYERMSLRHRDQIGLLTKDLELSRQHIDELKMDLVASKDEIYHQQLKMRNTQTETTLLIKENKDIYLANQALLDEIADLRLKCEASAKAESDNYKLVTHLNEVNFLQERRFTDLKVASDSILLACQSGQNAMIQMENGRTALDQAMRSLSAAQN
jgi:hypothetical protein